MTKAKLNEQLRFIALYVVLLALFGIFWAALRDTRFEAQRGIWLPGNPTPNTLPVTLETPVGTTVDLTQYQSEDEVRTALQAAKTMGIRWIRQEVRWDEIEVQQGLYEWSSLDMGLEVAQAEGLQIVLVLNRTPVWARQPKETDNPLAPPTDLQPFADFATAVAQRYGDSVFAYQIWDEPNLMPHWGTEVIIDPANYAAMLQTVAPALRAADPDALIVTAGLGPTLEPGGFNMSETRFLQGLYDAGGAGNFDVVALKPFGFWTGATERLYDESVLNFDRPVLVHEVMAANEDTTTPVWFVEGGWAVLPPNWQGDPPPWGSDSAAQQQPRLHDALERTALEWKWVQLVALQPLQPAVPPTNPQRGLALVDAEFAPTALGHTTTDFVNPFYIGPQGAEIQASWNSQNVPDLQKWDTAYWIVIGLLVLASGGLASHTRLLPWRAWGARFRDLPDSVQIATFAITALLFYFTDQLVIALVLYAAIGVLVAWRLTLGLAGVAFALPFFLQVKMLAGLQFSMVELLLVLCVLVWLGRGAVQIANRKLQITETGHDTNQPKISRFQNSIIVAKEWLWPRDALDWAIVAFVVWAGVSVVLAQVFGVASREFRVVVLESVMWYWLLRRHSEGESVAWWVVNALIAGVVVVSLYGLYQWLFTGDIITAEDVRRIRGTYGSPNNLALILERVIPIALSLWLLGTKERFKWWYAAALVPMGLCLVLTFSRGALLIGIPAALVWLAIWGGKTTRRAVAVVAGVGAVALIPFAATERLTSTVNVEGGTWFIRFKLWEATLQMIRDYPIFGVGLDNFLYVYNTYRLPEAWREPDLSHPHQLFLHFWVALGIPGVILLLWQQIAHWRGWAQNMVRTIDVNHRALLIGLGGSMVATLTHGMIDNSYFLVDLAFIWMMTFALSQNTAKERGSTETNI